MRKFLFLPLVAVLAVSCIGKVPYTEDGSINWTGKTADRNFIIRNATDKTIEFVSYPFLSKFGREISATIAPGEEKSILMEQYWDENGKYHPSYFLSSDSLSVVYGDNSQLMFYPPYNYDMSEADANFRDAGYINPYQRFIISDTVEVSPGKFHFDYIMTVDNNLLDEQVSLGLSAFKRKVEFIFTEKEGYPLTVSLYKGGDLYKKFIARGTVGDVDDFFDCDEVELSLYGKAVRLGKNDSSKLNLFDKGNYLWHPMRLSIEDKAVVQQLYFEITSDTIDSILMQ